ncbi:hypothetical protein N9544_04835 [Flavobacteriales bacterium]|nr:hypothetical protein [Flavobacteriales bacterium]
MRILYIFIVITIFSCTKTSNNPIDSNWGELEMELTGTLINDTLIFNQKEITHSNFSSIIYYKEDNKLINEIDIHINTKLDSIYPNLVNYYNNIFNSNKKDSIFNTWRTDSSEFILYKNSDSSILVNIFKRTYL